MTDKTQYLNSDLTPMDDAANTRIIQILERMCELDNELRSIVKPEAAEIENVYENYRDMGSHDCALTLADVWGVSEDVLNDRQSALEDQEEEKANAEAARIAPGLIDKDKEGQ